MPRYDSYGPRDSQDIPLMDVGFVGMQSYGDPAKLKPGEYQLGQNVRIEDEEIVPRKGMELLYKGTSTAGKMVSTSVYVDNNKQNHVFSTEFAQTSTGFFVITLWRWSHAEGRQSVGSNSTYGDISSMTQAYGRLFLHFEGRKSYRLSDFDDIADATWEAVEQSNQDVSPTNMPKGAGWSVFFRSRLAMPRNNYELGIGDILDNNSFDIRNQFTFNNGGRDYLVGASPWKEDRLLVFMRDSIHQLNGLSNLSTSTSEEVTNQYGCVARKTITQMGNSIVFLTDRGLVKADTTQDLKIHEGLTPFSLPIQDQLDQRNLSRQENCICQVFDNRLYFAWPSQGALYCDKMAVYDILLNRWVSIDTFNEHVEIVDLDVMYYEGRKRLICSTASKRRYVSDPYQEDEAQPAVYIMEERADGNDEFMDGSVESTHAYTSTIKTRRYTVPQFDKVKVHKFTADLNVSGVDSGGVPTAGTAELPFDLISTASATFGVTANLYDPDKTVTAGDYTINFSDEFPRPYVISRDAKSLDFDLSISGGGSVGVKQLKVDLAKSGSNYITRE